MILPYEISYTYEAKKAIGRHTEFMEMHTAIVHRNQGNSC